MKIRYPVVAGYFYESDPELLKKQIEESFLHPIGPGSLPRVNNSRVKTSIGYVSPHAGYMYSGPVAAHTYYMLAKEGKPDTIIIAGPNHTGLGTGVSVMIEGVWKTPLGDAVIDTELAKNIVKNSEYAAPDELAHMEEHSVEVQIPFLQYLFGNIKIVPIVLMLQTPSVAKDLANAINKASEELNRDIVFIASTDFSHYEPHEIASKKDRMAIDAILDVDPERLYRVIEKYNISMCGPGPVMTLLYLAKIYGVKKAELLKYATSGDVTGDKRLVVGYASIRVPSK